MRSLVAASHVVSRLAAVTWFLETCSIQLTLVAETASCNSHLETRASSSIAWKQKGGAWDLLQIYLQPPRDLSTSPS
ncbi:hypothetical protein F5Y18DRAFT_59096 [Xylariaceae sp. FL1019]|nr:hypothetical protein F5Y18DRAFT_59096 [Xylariaceae sp. FL1019]